MENREWKTLQPPNTAEVTRGVRDFTDLITWKTARILRANIYRLCCGFPKHETFEPGSQMRRTAVNIQFCRQSRGSVYELRDHLTTALDAGYITPDQHKEHDRQAISVARLINGYIRATKLRKVKAECMK
jgi:hypothetical protein